ncbi:hypothetical protein PSTT_01214, partial [Puccinia striiformis]
TIRPITMLLKLVLFLSMMATLGDFAAAVFGCDPGREAYCGSQNGNSCFLQSALDQSDGDCNPDVPVQKCCYKSKLRIVSRSHNPQLFIFGV